MSRAPLHRLVQDTRELVATVGRTDGDFERDLLARAATGVLAAMFSLHRLEVQHDVLDEPILTGRLLPVRRRHRATLRLVSVRNSTGLSPALRITSTAVGATFADHAFRINSGEAESDGTS